MSEPVKETSVVACKNCGETKIRYLAGKYPSNRDKKWVDADGFQWCGHWCPPCNRERVATAKRVKRKRTRS